MPTADRLVARAERNLQKNKTRAQSLTADIRKRSDRITEDAHAIGVALRKLSDAPMYTAMGYDSFTALLKSEKLMSKTQAYKLMAVADAYKSADLKKMGFEKAYALLSYAEATPAPDVARMLFLSNARIGNSYVNAMSIRAIRNAANRVRLATGQNRGTTGPEKLARSAARKLQARLRKSGVKLAKASVVRREGKWKISVEFDVEDAGKLG